MTTLLDRLQGVEPLIAYLVVGGFVFVEDALLIGFLVPGETAAIVGGVVASQSHVRLWVMIAVVVLAAILGDNVGYGIGRRVGPRMLRVPLLGGPRVAGAADLLRRRGGPAVFLGRFVAFVRTVMPALAGVSGMPYRRFLGFNAVAAIIFGLANVIAGYAAGNSYRSLESLLGNGVWVLVGVVALAAGGWAVRRRLRSRHAAPVP